MPSGTGIAARCQAKGPDEMAVQVALISKSGAMCNIGKWLARPDQVAGKVNAPLDQIGVRGQSGGTGKFAHGLKFA